MDPHGEIPTDNPCSAVINIEDELIPGEKIAELTERANNSLHDGRPEWKEDGLSSACAFVVPSHFSAIPRETMAERRRPCAMVERKR